VIVVVSVLVILAATLFPYDFYLGEMSWTLSDRLQQVGIVKTVNFLVNILGNILLFVPLGFGLTCLAQQRRLAGKTIPMVVVATGCFISLGVESLQIFLPTRFPSVLDVVTNSTGTFIGLVVFRSWGPIMLGGIAACLERAKELLSLKGVVMSFLGYTGLAFVLSMALQQKTNLSDWDDTFPLLIGNEQTANRPWRGNVFRLQIANRAISKEEVAQTFFRGRSVRVHQRTSAGFLSN